MVIDFEITDGTHVFRDAIVLPDDHNLSNDEIEAMKQARFDKWIEIITTPVDTEWQVDEEGNQILDENGNPIPVEV